MYIGHVPVLLKVDEVMVGGVVALIVMLSKYAM